MVPLSKRWRILVVGLGVLLAGGAMVTVQPGGDPGPPVFVSRVPAPASAPHVVLITVDALRADRLSSYGYGRATSPMIDELLTAGARFTEARTEEPLTTPALASMLSGVSPHRHGASRNGLKVAPELDSLALQLARSGWRTGAFVSNWVLSDDLSGLGSHFDRYEEVLTRKRYWGLFEGEARAPQVNRAAIGWLQRQRTVEPERAVMLWVHYVDPHAPYERHEAQARRLGVGRGESENYDTEVAFVDRHVGHLLGELDRLLGDREVLVMFASDHGESLGEHDYWWHGKHLYEPELHIPLGFVWRGRIPPATVTGQVVLTDVAPTVLGLLGQPAPAGLDGRDHSDDLLAGASPAPDDRCFQAHKGVVLMDLDSDRSRSTGLLAVGRVADGVKEVYYLEGRSLRFDLARDPEELRSNVDENAPPSAALRPCLEQIARGLGASNRLPATGLDARDRQKLRSLGYLD